MEHNMSQENKSSTVIGITVSAEMAAKLETAFYGLPDQRQDSVYEAEKTLGRNQAIFNEIFGQKLDHYYDKGVEKKTEILRKTIADAVANSGKSWNECAAFLNLKQFSVEEQKPQVVAVNPQK
jgi:hypothetical protein